jgi:hypothetical protein
MREFDIICGDIKHDASPAVSTRDRVWKHRVQRQQKGGVQVYDLQNISADLAAREDHAEIAGLLKNDDKSGRGILKKLLPEGYRQQSQSN